MTPHRAETGLTLLVALCLTSLSLAAPAVYRSAHDVAFSPDGTLLAVTDHTAGRLVLIDAASGSVKREAEIQGKPVGVVWAPDGASVFVAGYEGGAVTRVQADNGKVLATLSSASWPAGLALAPKRGLLLVTDYARNALHAVDIASGEASAVIPVGPMPWAVAVTPDETLAVVGHSIPAGASTNNAVSCRIELIDLETMKPVAEVPLLPGSINLFGLAVSSNGKWVYLVHNMGRFMLPTTQLDRGWVNTNVLTIFDLAKRACYATVPLDTLSRGATNPWGVALSPDDNTLWIALSGAHKAVRVNVAGLHALLAEKDDPARNALAYDLSALTVNKLAQLVTLPGNGPRGIAVSPDGSKIAAAMYFSGNVAMLDTNGTVTADVPLGPQPEADTVRTGERIFFDGDYGFQGWLSCSTCHPHGRADGLNWDLLNDGIGNPKNTRSLVLSDKTPPVMSLGVRSDMQTASRAGFRFILFRQPEEAEDEAVIAYLRALPPSKSPYLLNGKLSPEAEKGKRIFESAKTSCATCHPAPLYTDLKSYEVGTGGKLDRDKTTFDCPTLVELWRTPPYLHDGSAATLRDVLTTCNRNDTHGVTSHLSEKDIDALVAFMLSL
jgi:DNA-binding beta-propeller fold protein YncE